MLHAYMLKIATRIITVTTKINIWKKLYLLVPVHCQNWKRQNYPTTWTLNLTLTLFLTLPLSLIY